MAVDNPIFGVGPGNWPVKYQRYAPGGDKSLAESGMTANPGDQVMAAPKGTLVLSIPTVVWSKFIQAA